MLAQERESMVDALGTVSNFAVPLPLVVCPAREVPVGAVTDPDMVMDLLPSVPWVISFTDLVAISTQSLNTDLLTVPLTVEPLTVREYDQVPSVGMVRIISWLSLRTYRLAVTSELLASFSTTEFHTIIPMI